MTTFGYLPLTDDTWDSFEEVMGICQGGDSGCWCTWWRLARSKFEELSKEGRKQYLKELVQNGQHIGIIAFENQIPFGWCAIAPVMDYPVILRSRIVKPTLNDSCWYISCFFIKAGFRRKGAMSMLISYALDYAKKNGATIVEACPKDNVRVSNDLFVGKTSVFIKLGFKQIHKLSDNRPMLRLIICQY